VELLLPGRTPQGPGPFCQRRPRRRLDPMVPKWPPQQAVHLPPGRKARPVHGLAPQRAAPAKGPLSPRPLARPLAELVPQRAATGPGPVPARQAARRVAVLGFPGRIGRRGRIPGRQRVAQNAAYGPTGCGPGTIAGRRSVPFGGRRGIGRRAILPFHLGNLFHPAGVPSAFERGFQPDFQHSLDHLFVEHFAGKAEDVGIVV